MTESSTRSHPQNIHQIADLADEYLNDLSEVHLFNGAVLMASQGEIILSEGYGFANREWDIPNHSGVKFRIASLTKPITAVAVLKLQEEGKLNVKDSLGQYLPGFLNAEKITLHHLLTHSSGIFNITDLTDFSERKNSPTTLEKSVALFSQRPLKFEPGDHFEYSNSNYILLSYLIEKISGKTYEEYLKEKIFGPLGMNNSGYDYNSTVLEQRASGYTFHDGELRHGQYLDMSWAGGSGGLYSTIEDLFLFDQALYQEKLLKKELRDLLFTPYFQMPKETGANNYGYGWELGEISGRPFAGHPGVIFGFTTQLFRFLRERLVIIVLSNFEQAESSKIGRELAALVFKNAKE